MKREKIVPCPNCGELVRIDFAKDDPRCPVCGAAGRRPPPKPPSASKSPQRKAKPSVASAPVIEALDEPAAPQEDAYAFNDKDHVRCKHCTLQLPRDQLVCVRCGVNQATGEKAVRVFSEFRRQWHGGWPPARRLGLFLAGLGVQTLFTVLGVVFWDETAVLVSSFVLFAALASFVLGTYDSVELERTAKGRIRIRKRWNACFVRFPWRELKLGDYEGVVISRDQGFEGDDWILLGALFLMGGLPGIIFWVYASGQTNYLVALSQHHGHAAMPLYRGWNEQLSKDMSKTLQDVAGLPMQS